MSIYYRLSENRDPEERLEDAAMWKAMHDEYGDDIEAIGFEDDREGIIFGRGRRYRGAATGQPVPEHLPYWTDPVFLRNAGRSFEVLQYEECRAAVSRLHEAGKAAFIKSTRPKHAILRVPIGHAVGKVFGDLVLSFIDGGPALMVQQDCRVEFEHRFFVIDREIVTDSPIQWALTPIDYPLPEGALFKTPKETKWESQYSTYRALRSLAAKVAATMRYPHASVDCAMINRKPAVVEFNPMQIGQLGLYACDVRALANATRKLISPTADVEAA